MASDEDLGRNFKVSVSNDIIDITVLNQVADEVDSDQMTKLSIDEVKKILTDHADKIYDMIVVLSTSGSGQSYSQQSRKMHYNLIKNPQIDKVAICAPGTLVKMMVNFMAAATGKGNKVKWFDDKEEAFLWMGEKRSKPF